MIIIGEGIFARSLHNTFPNARLVSPRDISWSSENIQLNDEVVTLDTIIIVASSKQSYGNILKGIGYTRIIDVTPINRTKEYCINDVNTDIPEGLTYLTTGGCIGTLVKNMIDVANEVNLALPSNLYVDCTIGRSVTGKHTYTKYDSVRMYSLDNQHAHHKEIYNSTGVNVVLQPKLNDQLPHGIVCSFVTFNTSNLLIGYVSEKDILIPEDSRIHVRVIPNIMGRSPYTTVIGSSHNINSIIPFVNKAVDYFMKG